MSDHISTDATSSVASGPLKTDDPAWAHCRMVPGKRSQTNCIYCGKLIKGGGITRFKMHLAGVKGEVEPCKMVSHDVKWQMKRLLEEHQKERRKRQKVKAEIGHELMLIDEDVFGTTVGPSSTSSYHSKQEEVESGTKRKKITSYFVAPRTMSGAQKSIKNAKASKDMIVNARNAIARWWYDAKIPFSAANSVYYQPMLDAILACGPGFQGPSFHDLRGSLLRNSVSEVQDYLLDIKETWKTYGCTIMSDGWTNRKQEPLINFLVYCPKGTIFLKSVDVSGLTRSADTLFEIFDEVVKEVGPSNIVQFVTDNESSYKEAGNMLQSKYKHFFWSPCATHCIDLLLENLEDPRYFPAIDETMKKAKQITNFIYNHGFVINLMRKEYTNGRELCRPGVTRFATNFLTLQSLLKFKRELCQMFYSNEWLESRYAKINIGKAVAKIVLEDREFWSNCQQVVKVSEPMLRVLRLTDDDEKPSMGYLYEAMDKAKETIRKNFKDMISSYSAYIQVIDAVWDKQLYSPLHSAGCFLNPGSFFRPDFNKKNEVTRGLLSAIMKLIPDDNEQDLISSQIEEYKECTGDFGMAIAIRQRERLNPVAWWEQFGNDCPELQKFAIRVLSQCASATGCEKNWRIFEFVDSKKHNRLEHKRLNDLVFVRYNLKLQERNISRRGNALDPISLDNIDILSDWIAEEPPLLSQEDIEADLGWEMVDAPLTTLTLNDDDDEIQYDDDLEILPPPNMSQYDIKLEDQTMLTTMLNVD